MKAIFTQSVLLLGISTLFSGESRAEDFDRVNATKLNGVTAIDQFGKTHRFQFPTRRPVLVTTAGQRGSRDIESWIRPIGEEFYGKVEIIGIAQLEGVPASLRGPLRKLIAMHSANHPVLLDWNGELCRLFPYSKNTVSVSLLDQNGTGVWAATGKVTPAELEELRQQLRKMVR
tara:strand:- start:7536 stop:8057 length:522 start_codon:yes stop_codon:yes gene_type:complete